MRHGFIIVFNGKHTLRACAWTALKSVDRLCIVEGAVQHIADRSNSGHSTDGTMQVIESLQAEFPDKVISVIGQAEFWCSKLDMCNMALEALRPVDGEWIIEFDSDEFYFSARLNEMMGFLEGSDYNCAEVWGRHYYGDLNHHIPMREKAWGNSPPWRRMFRYEGLPWISHTPPRLGVEKHEVLFTRDQANDMFGVQLHHAGYCWRDQVELKAAYFNDPTLLNKWDIYQETGAYHPVDQEPVEYNGPKPWGRMVFQ